MHGTTLKRISTSAALLTSAILTVSSDTNPPAAFVSLSPPPNISLRHEVKQAIDKGLIWLEKNQDTNGYWSVGNHPAITGLALISFKGRPDAMQEPDPPAVSRGYAHLLSCVHPDGGIYRKDLPSYNTAVALTALCLANKPEYMDTILRARKFLTGLQYDGGEPGKVDTALDGGMGYGVKDKTPDLSNTSFVIEALAYSKRLLSDKNVGDIGDLKWDAAIHFVQSCQNLKSFNAESWASNDGGFIYAPGRTMGAQTNLPSGGVAFRSYGSMSYAGLLSYIYADLKRDDPRVNAVVEWLKANFTLAENPGLGAEGVYYYYNMMAKALTLYGADTFELSNGQKVNWREQLALKLINLQRADGSWVNESGRWMQKDPALVTPFSLISLETIYPKL